MNTFFFLNFEVIGVGLNYAIFFFILIYLFIKKKPYRNLAKKRLMWLIIVLLSVVLIRLVILNIFNPHLEDPSFGGIAQTWTYQCQGLQLNSASGIFQKSMAMYDCHPSHGSSFGFFLGILQFFLNPHSTVYSIIFIQFLAIINSALIFLFITKNVKNRNELFLGYFIIILFNLVPMFFLESAYSSVQYFVTPFVIATTLGIYYFKSHRQYAVLAFILVSANLASNVQISYGLYAVVIYTGISILIALKKIKFKEKIKDYLIVLALGLSNIHLIGRSLHNANPEGAFGIESLRTGFLVEMMRFEKIILGFLIFFAVVSIILFFLKPKKKWVYLTYIPLLLFFISFNRFRIGDLRYTYLIVCSFIVPFILFEKKKYVLLILLLFGGLQHLNSDEMYASYQTDLTSVTKIYQKYNFDEITICGRGYFDTESIIFGLEDKFNTRIENMDKLTIEPGKVYFITGTCGGFEKAPDFCERFEIEYPKRLTDPKAINDLIQIYKC